MPSSKSRRPPNRRPAQNRSGNPALRDRPPATGTQTRTTPGSGAQSQRRFQRNQRLILGLSLIGVVVILVVALGVFASIRSNRDPVAPAPQPTFGAATLTSGKPILLGRPDAPVTLTLFEDFNCPHCSDFEKKLGPTITDLQRSGTVKVALYPMSFVGKSSPAVANAMACSATEGFGQQYRAGLFANYGLKWSDQQLIKLASLVGSPSAGFADCVRSSQHAAWVDSITSAAEQQKVKETPTVFINGVRKPDAPDWSAAELRSQIEAAK
jgi:protein-disulfide isomerase